MSETAALPEQTPQRLTVPPSRGACDPHTPDQPPPSSASRSAAPRVRRLTLVSGDDHTMAGAEPGQAHTCTQAGTPPAVKNGEERGEEEEDAVVTSSSLLSRPHTPLARQRTCSPAAMHASTTAPSSTATMAAPARQVREKVPALSLAAITSVDPHPGNEERSCCVSEGDEAGNASETTSSERGRGISLSTSHEGGTSCSPERVAAAATIAAANNTSVQLEGEDSAAVCGATADIPPIAKLELGGMEVRLGSPPRSPSISSSSAAVAVVTAAAGVEGVCTAHMGSVRRAMSRAWLAASERQMRHNLALHRRQLVTMWSTLVVEGQAMRSNSNTTSEAAAMMPVTHTAPPPPLPRPEAASPRSPLAVLGTRRSTTTTTATATSATSCVWTRLLALLQGSEPEELGEMVKIYMEARWEAYRRAALHLAFDAMYLVMVAVPATIRLERNARRQLCMQRDLFMRDRIELFVLTAPCPKPFLLRHARHRGQPTFMQTVMHFLQRSKAPQGSYHGKGGRHGVATREHGAMRRPAMSYAERRRSGNARAAAATRRISTRTTEPAASSVTLPRIAAATSAKPKCLRAREVIEPRMRPRTPVRCPSEDQFFSFGDVQPQ